METFPIRIATENFEDAVSCVNKLAASVKRKCIIKKIVRPISSILFCLLSLLLVFGALYGSATPEEMLVFDDIRFLVDIWTGFSSLFAVADSNWYVSWSIMIAVTFAIPLAFSAIVTIIVSLCVKETSPSIDADTDAQKAKDLFGRANAIAQKASNYDSGATKTLFTVIFILGVAALLGYAFFMLKLLGSFDVGTLIGAVIALALVYLIYGLIFRIFEVLNKLFYKMPSVSSLLEKIDAYWLSVDPEEAKRRQEEQAKKEAAHAASPSSPSQAIDKYDSFTWTYGYVRDNEQLCSEISLSVLKVSKELLEERDYSGAAAGFDKVVRGLEMLAIHDKEFYTSPLYANCYALSRIFAFGLNNKASALKYAEKACDYASECNSRTASNDLYKMREYRDALRSSSSLSVIASDFKLEFPYDILSSN